MTTDVLDDLRRLMETLPPREPRLLFVFSAYCAPGRSPLLPGLHGAGTETVVMNPVDRPALERAMAEAGWVLRPTLGHCWEATRPERVP